MRDTIREFMYSLTQRLSPRASAWWRPLSVNKSRGSDHDRAIGEFAITPA
jgi:hypothetical protein